MRMFFKVLYKNGYTSLIYSSPQIKHNMNIHHQKMTQQIMLYSYSEMILSNEKECISDAHSNMDEFQ